jgi:hypothetical protein
VEVVRGSFRDPSGFVYTADGTLYRQVNRVFAEEFDACVASGLYDDLAAGGLLVPHRNVGVERGATPDAHAVIEPARIDFVSYPYEWAFGELRDAALLTLDVQERALARGFVLRDASAYNVQFADGRPLFIDTLSFARYREGEPWAAYKQFCEHFSSRCAHEHTTFAAADSSAIPGWHTARPGSALLLGARGRAPALCCTCTPGPEAVRGSSVAAVTRTRGLSKRGLLEPSPTARHGGTLGLPAGTSGRTTLRT